MIKAKLNYLPLPITGLQASYVIALAEPMKTAWQVKTFDCQIYRHLTSEELLKYEGAVLAGVPPEQVELVECKIVEA